MGIKYHADSWMLIFDPPARSDKISEMRCSRSEVKTISVLFFLEKAIRQGLPSKILDRWKEAILQSGSGVNFPGILPVRVENGLNILSRFPAFVKKLTEMLSGFENCVHLNSFPLAPIVQDLRFHGLRRTT